MSPIVLLASFLISQPLWAATFEAPVKEGDRLVLKGFEAQVQIIAQPGVGLKVSGVEDSGVEGAYTISKKGNIIEVSMNELNGKRNWLGALPKASTYMRKIEITGAPVPVEVHLRGGSVTVQKWSKDLKVSLTQGRFSSVDGRGSFDVAVQKGEVNIQNHAGKVQADVYSGSVVLKSIQGDVDASLFVGQLVAEKLKGFIDITTQQATGKINQSGGTLQFENVKGQLTVQAFQGRIEGQSADGSVSVVMNMDSEVDIRAKAGKVTVQTPPGSGASVNLFTVDGDIYVPKELRVVKLSSEKSVRGRLRGESPRGSILVRGQEANIFVK
ncbi:hypothetical protein D3C87_259400 [compost metagenome]